MKKRFVLIFLLTLLSTLLLYGCNDERPEETVPTENESEWYVSLAGDVLQLQGDVFSLTYAGSETVYAGTYLRQGDLIILFSEDGDKYVSLDNKKVFSFVDMDNKKETETVEPVLCEHVRTELRSHVEPTCEKEGYSGDLYCVDCQEMLQKGAVMEPAGHNFTVESDIVCQEGYCVRNQTNYYKCSVCGAVGDKTYEVPNTASGEHHFTSVGRTVFLKATCADNQVNYAACSVCGTESKILTIEVENTATGRHDFSKPSTKKLYQEADCGHNAIYFYECSVCGMPSLDPSNTYEVEGTKTGAHDYSKASGLVKAEATCVQNRIEYAACSVCGTIDMNFEVEVANTATGRHLFTALSDIEASKATCTQDKTVYSKCAYCGLLNRTRALRVAATATGHEYENYICTDCGAVSDNYEANKLYDVSFDKNIDSIRSYFFVSEDGYDLVLYGKGSMESYASATGAPWASFAENVQNVFIAGMIDKIGDYAFAGMTQLTSVRYLPVPVNNQPDDFAQNYASYYTRIGNNYTLNTSDEWQQEKKYYVLSERTLRSIGNYAFYYCSALEKLSLPLSVQRLGMGALSYCESLKWTNISALSSFTSAGENLFYKDIALTQINLTGTALTRLSQGMFSECYSLSSVSFPSSLTEIDAYCFFETAIPEITLPSSIRSVGAYAFAECGWTKKVVFSGSECTSIGEGAFYGDTMLGDIIFSSGITSIGEKALEGTAYYNRYGNWTGGVLYLNGREYFIKGVSEETYLTVEPLETDDPHARGWYKKEWKGYVLSTDTFCRGNKRYYEYYKDENEEKFIVAQTEPSPSQMHWYEMDGGNYVPSEDISCQAGKTYYEYWEKDGRYLIARTRPYNPVEEGWYEREYDLVLADEIGVNPEETYYQKINPIGGEMTLNGATALVADGAMKNCIDITGITLSDSVAYIGKNAFYYCYNAVDLDLKQVVSIGDSAFYGCSKLVAVKIPTQTEEVGEYAFADCTSLRSFAWNNTTTVADTALYGNNLFEVFRPTGTDNAFGAQVIFDGKYDQYDSASTIDSDGTFVYSYSDGKGYLLGCLKPETRDLTLPETFYVKGQAVFSYTIFKNAFSPFATEDSASVFYSQLHSVVIPSSVVAIEDKAFYGCSYLSSISMPLNVYDNVVRMSIGDNVFGATAYSENDNNWENGLLYLTANNLGNSNGYFLLRARSEIGVNIETTTVKDNTRLIADKAFFDAGCRLIKTLVLPSSILLIGDNALTGCTGITSLTTPFVGKTLPTTKTQEDSFLAYFFGASTYEDNVSIPSTLTTLSVTGGAILPDHCLEGCSFIKTLSFNNVVHFGESALKDCGQASIRIVKNVQSADASSFENCQKLNKINFATSITEIGDRAFYNTGLTQVNLNEKNITTIGEEAFADCAYLYELKLGSKIESIGSRAFENCIGLLSVSFDSVFPEGWCSDKQTRVLTGSNVKVEFCDCDVIGSVQNEEVSIDNMASHSSQMLDSVVARFDTVSEKLSMLLNTVADSSRTNGWRALNTSDIMSRHNEYFSAIQALFGESKDALLDGISFTAQTSALISFTEKYIPVSDPTNIDLGFYYEYAGGVYTKTADTSVVSNKTYYTKVAGFIPQRKYVKVTDKNSGDFNSYYELISGNYVRSITMDGNEYDGSKTYYREMTCADYMTVIAGIFGYTESDFLAKVAAVATEYRQNNAGASVVANPDNNAGRLKYNGAVLTENGSYVLPFAFKNNRTSTVVACLVVDASGNIYMWLSNVDEAKKAINLNNVLNTSTTLITTVHGRCMLFPWSNVIGENAFSGCKKLVEIGYPNKKDILTGSGAAYGHIADYVKRVYNNKQDGASTILRTYKNFIMAEFDDEHYLLSYIGELIDPTTGLPQQINLPDEYLDGIKEYKIYAYAFAQNKITTNVRLSSAVTGIGESAFEGCTSLVSVTDLSSVKTIGRKAFLGSGLEGINIPSATTVIESQAFEGCLDLQTVSFGSRVSYIGARAFYDCEALRTIALPTSVREIGDEAFARCIAANSVTVQSILESVGVDVFADCSKLTTVRWYSSSDLNIGSHIFKNAGTENGINVTFYCTNVPNYLFYTGDTATAPFITSVTFDSRYAIKTIGTYAFYYLSINSIVLPSTLESIGAYAFSKSNLRSLTIPENVTTIGVSAFEDCTDLASVNIPFVSRLTMIYDRAFYNTALETLSLPQSVLSVGVEAFANCNNLRYVAFDVSIVEINATAFNDCSSNMNVYIVRKEALNSEIDTIKASFAVDTVFVNVYFEPTSYTVRTGAQSRLSLANTVDLESVDYLSTNTNVLTVGRDGTIQGQSTGEVTITATITFRSGLQIRLSCSCTVVS